MVELKSGYGVFFYSTKISGAKTSESLANAIGIDRVDAFLQKLKNKGCYMIAKVSAFQDYEYGNSNVPTGLYMTSGRDCGWMTRAVTGWTPPVPALRAGSPPPCWS